MNSFTKNSYRKFRQSGMSANQAIDSARVYNQFTDYEIYGLARLQVEPDNDMSADNVCDCDDPHCKAVETFKREGAFITIGQVRLGKSDVWETVDSCGGHVGYKDVASPFENWYVVDHMRACVAAIQKSEFKSILAI